MNIDKLTDA